MIHKKTIINIKADKKVKEQAQELAERLGVPLSTIINSFLKQFIRTEEVTFSAAHTMTPELGAVLKQVEADREKGKNIRGPFTVTEAIDHLSSL
jgi:addiction module RelB/DinJ family antitoxin